MAHELFGCVVPAYVLCVAVIPTLVEVNLPKYLFATLAKTRPLPRRLTEKSAALCPFESCFRYSDLLSGICAMWSMLFFLDTKVWQTMGFCLLLVFLHHVYSKWHYLRAYGSVKNNSERLAWHALHWWCVPVTMLVVAAVLHGMMAGVIPQGSARVGAIVHLVVFFLGLKLIQ